MAAIWSLVANARLGDPLLYVKPYSYREYETLLLNAT
jgi:hypothetical protein